MRNLLFVFVVLFGFNLNADPTPKVEAPIVTEQELVDLFMALAPKATLDDYEQTYNKYTALVEKMDDPAMYENMEFTSDDKVILYKDMTDFRKGLYHVFMYQKLTDEMYNLQNHWARDFHDKESKLPKAQIVEYVIKLNSYRYKFSLKFEKYMETFFDKYKSDIPPKDADFFMKRVKSWHKAQWKPVETKND